MAYATTADVAALLQRSLTDVETAAATAMLDQASALVRLRFADFDDRTAANPDLALVATGVVAESVARVLRNPDGKVQESIDDYAYRRADAVADGALYLTADQWSMLAPTRARIGSIKLVTWQ